MTADYCDVYWGSHGCDRDPGHDGPHVCADHSMLERVDGECLRSDAVWVTQEQEAVLVTWTDPEPTTVFSDHGVLRRPGGGAR